jgi:hypothetical protein
MITLWADLMVSLDYQQVSRASQPAVIFAEGKAYEAS